MKNCAIIAEYNPFHLGHLRQIEYVKKELRAETVTVIMSGNFTERGEIAVLNKFTRAKEAVLLGVDAVIELPTVFATANAETFSLGAIKLINDLGYIDGICFGIESGKKEDYIALAKEMNNESREFKKLLKENLDKGYSLCKSKFEAVKSLGKDFDENLISSPNNVLGLEYVKAILKTNDNIEIFPLIRNSDHNDKTLKKGITSATSIREVIKTGRFRKLKRNLPRVVYKDLKKYPLDFEKAVLTALTVKTEDEISKVPDCSEGLENRIKALYKDNKSLDELIKKVATKRYTESRIRRILLCNLLGIKKDMIAKFIDSKLYAKILAVKDKEFISKINTGAKIPVLTRKSDYNELTKTAKSCFDIDVLANDLYNLIAEEKTNEYWTEIIEK